MPNMNGIEATAKIKAKHPEIIVIGLSVNTSGETQKAMLKAGAVALLLKEAAVKVLYQMIFFNRIENKRNRFLRLIPASAYPFSSMV